jgi:hypothetical protein
MTSSADDFLSRYFKDEAVKGSFGYLSASTDRWAAASFTAACD